MSQSLLALVPIPTRPLSLSSHLGSDPHGEEWSGGGVTGKHGSPGPAEVAPGALFLPLRGPAVQPDEFAAPPCHYQAARGGVCKHQRWGSRGRLPISCWWLHGDLLGLLHFPLVRYKHIYTTRVTDKFPL